MSLIDRLAKASHEACDNADFARKMNRKVTRLEISAEAAARYNAALEKLHAAKQANAEIRAKFAASGIDLDALEADIIKK